MGQYDACTACHTLELLGAHVELPDVWAITLLAYCNDCISWSSCEQLLQVSAL